jgi:Methylase of polypeptide chain release factors
MIVKVKPWDISKQALKVAKKNAQTNNVKIDFKQVDILDNNYIII